MLLFHTFCIFLLLSAAFPGLFIPAPLGCVFSAHPVLFRPLPIKGQTFTVLHASKFMRNHLVDCAGLNLPFKHSSSLCWVAEEHRLAPQCGMRWSCERLPRSCGRTRKLLIRGRERKREEAEKKKGQPRGKAPFSCAHIKM